MTPGAKVSSIEALEALRSSLVLYLTRSRVVLEDLGQEIVRAAKREKCQLVVMGTHGHGLLGRALMGSVAQTVVTDSEVPVLLVK